MHCLLAFGTQNIVKTPAHVTEMARMVFCTRFKLFKAVLSWSCIFQIPLTQALTITITQMTLNLYRHFADAESKEGSKKTHILYVKNN